MFKNYFLIFFEKFMYFDHKLQWGCAIIVRCKSIEMKAFMINSRGLIFVNKNS